MSGSYAARAPDKELDKGRVTQTKVKRYWAGRAPEWQDAEQTHDQAAAPKERTRTEVVAPVIVRRADDPRLRRLAEAQHNEEDKEEALQRRREIRAAEVVKRRGEEQEEVDISSHGQHGHAEADGDEDLPVARHQRQDAEDDSEALKRRQAMRERWAMLHGGDEFVPSPCCHAAACPDTGTPASPPALFQDAEPAARTRSSCSSRGGR